MLRYIPSSELDIPSSSTEAYPSQALDLAVIGDKPDGWILIWDWRQTAVISNAEVYKEGRVQSVYQNQNGWRSNGGSE